ncbi:MAG TPA: hypothetical protein VFU15_07105, partial [Bacteroidia bacterium]|nr:hypothetical protein [Bacteroidia bacterium]
DGRAPGSGGPDFGDRFIGAVASENHIVDPTQREINRVVVDQHEQNVANAQATASGNQPGDSRGTANTGNSSNPVNGRTDVRNGAGTNGSTMQRSDTPGNPYYNQPNNSGRSDSHPAIQNQPQQNDNTPSRSTPTYHSQPDNNTSRPHFNSSSSSAPTFDRGSSGGGGGGGRSSSGSAGGGTRSSGGGGTSSRPR